MQFEWDDNKNDLNRRKHGIEFKDAIAVFADSYRVEEIDVDSLGEGERITVIGMAHGRLLFVVAATLDEDLYRIISAPKGHST